MVHINTKYPVEEKDVELLPENKRRWWLKNNTTGEFVSEFPKLSCTEAVDVELTLPDGQYTMGCGDWNCVNDEGRHVQKRVYFAVSEGHIKYYKSMADLKSGTTDGGGSFNAFGSDEKTTSFNAFGGPTQSSLPSTSHVDKYEPIDSNIVRYCTKTKQCVSPTYNCITEFLSKEEGLGSEDCSTCMFSRKMFYKEE